MTAPIYGSKQYVQTFFTGEVVEARPTGWLIALHTDNPAAGDSNEVVGGTYMRQNVTFVAEEKANFWEAASDIDVVFPAADVGQAYTVTHYTVRDALSGECLAIGVLPVSIPIMEGSVLSFPAQYIKVRGV